MLGWEPQARLAMLALLRKLGRTPCRERQSGVKTAEIDQGECWVAGKQGGDGGVASWDDNETFSLPRRSTNLSSFKSTLAHLETYTYLPYSFRIVQTPIYKPQTMPSRTHLSNMRGLSIFLALTSHSTNSHYGNPRHAYIPLLPTASGWWRS
ncbi:hypothetical protein PM082_015449 [Marasmius tenuissimus]|nr:hypothetical protein PM082_015449 [Marasmius tenuissimus]